MHIKSIYIDGFKSYAKRTEITGFDPAFNAITGLNGSGKSNILDAICFLLGITNLSQVRASNLQDLVYKSGQAGVTKATVSIIFDNSEKSESPVGYAQFDEITITRQIVIGGKNKYLINGINATNARVHDLFHSVQLNVNNPHFLIMQGRITKVLNMKPPEILSLLEEAASTKHYEAKREDTLKTIEKKDGKLREIDKILSEEIKPTLAKLKEERNSYLEYQKVIRELEYLNKLIIAYDYFNKKAIVDNSDGELARMKELQTTEEQTIIKCDRDKLQIEQEIQEKTSERENVMVKKLEELHAKYSELQKDEVILKNAIKRAEDGVKESMNHVKNLEKQSIEERENHTKLREEISKIESQFTELQNRVNKSKADLELAQNRLKNVNSGFFQSDESGEKTGSLSELLAEAEKFESSCEIELNVLKMKKNHLEKLVGELKEKLRGMKKKESAETQEKRHGELKRNIDELEQEILKCGYSKDKEEKLNQELSGINRKIRETVTEKEQFFRSHQRLLFEYRKPSSNFDTKKIIGMVVKLVNLKDPQFNVAMEIGGGSKLYDVVVDHSQTSVELISKKLLMKRTTLLPLNAMQASPIRKEYFYKAQEILGAGNVWYPLELIDFDDQNTKAIQYVFGNFLIARDLQMANTVAFNPEIRCKCVTLDGEVFEPEGTLVGGNQPTDTKIYDQAKKSVEFDNLLTQLDIDKSNIEEELRNIEKARDVSEKFQKKLRSNQVELQQLERRMMEDDYLEVQKNLTDNQNELGQITEKISVQSKQYEIAKTKTSEARHNLKNSALVQERAQQAAQLNLKNAQEQLMKNEEAFKDIEFRYESLTMELRENENEKKNFQSTLESANQLVTAKKEELAQSTTKYQNHTEIMTASKQQLDEQKRTVKNIDTKISQLKEGLKDCSKLKDQATLKLSEVNHRITCHKKDSEDAERNVIKMLKKYNWINDEQKYFNQPGGIYDFNNRNWRDAGQKIELLEDQKRKLSRKVDLRGMNVLAQTEERYNDLMSKYVKVLQDKKILQTVIDELDKMKDKVIKKAHEQVDNDFNNIFSTLLPGSQARLVPPEGKTIIEGLEFKIAFGNVWKESLNELSGGQRSLVALSLILALLRFKPAPLYILDEVDAALDISHTQNIGTIIKEQFSNSQFIIVSLKDGMFNNANVLFKTKFVDGVSTVTRHARR